MTSHDRAYAEQLGDVLRRRSVSALRDFLEAQAGRYGDERQVEAIRAQSDAELESIMHRMTLARADLAGLHAESERWLAAQGGADPNAHGTRAGAPPRGAGPRRRRRPPRASS